MRNLILKRNNNRTIFLVLFVSAVLLAGIARFNIGQASAPIALQQNQNLTVIPPSDGNALSTSPSVSWLPFTPQSSSGNNISLFDITLIVLAVAAVVTGIAAFVASKQRQKNRADRSQNV